MNAAVRCAQAARRSPLSRPIQAPSRRDLGWDMEGVGASKCLKMKNKIKKGLCSHCPRGTRGAVAFL